MILAGMIIGYDPECLSLGTGVWDFFLTDIVTVPGTALLLSFPGTANHGPYSFSIYQACQPLEVAGTTNLRGGLGICISFPTCWISARCRAKLSGVYIQPSRHTPSTSFPSIPHRFPVSRHGGSNCEPQSVRLVQFPISFIPL